MCAFVRKQEFKAITQRAIDLNTAVPNEDAHTQFMAIDFGICEENGRVMPKLIEVQGFPSIFNFQFNLFRKIQKYYPFTSEMTPYLSGMDEDAYLNKLKEGVLNGNDISEVVLLEIERRSRIQRLIFTIAIEI